MKRTPRQRIPEVRKYRSHVQGESTNETLHIYANGDSFDKPFILESHVLPGPIINIIQDFLGPLSAQLKI
jgi:hypothetical protein